MAIINNNNSTIYKQIINEFSSLNDSDSITSMYNKVKTIIENDIDLSNQQKIKALENLNAFSAESQKPLDIQDINKKKLSWDNFTEVVKFSTAISGLIATISKIAGVA